MNYVRTACRNRVNKLIEDTKAIYFKNKLENIKNSKEGWKTINLLLNKKSKSTQIHEIKDGDNIVTGDKTLASAFNNYFSKTGSNLSKKLPSNNIDPLSYVKPVSEVFNLTNISKADLKREISKAKSGKSAGLDKISNKLLEIHACSNPSPLTKSMQLYFRNYMKYYYMKKNLH